MDHETPNLLSPCGYPTYKHPPINEVVCGMRVQTPDKLRIPHIGLLWEKFRENYPIIQHAPPIASAMGEIPVDDATGIPVPRVWFINQEDDQLVQFQPDRFYFNWRRRQNVYPRYTHVIENFENVQNAIANFFNENDLGELMPTECELSYINHIAQGPAWTGFGDLPKIFSDFVWKQKAKSFLPIPTNVAWSADFPLQESKGTLTVSLKHAKQRKDNIPVLVFELTARGIGESKSKTAIREWFNLAHKWILGCFEELTTPEVQRIWGREENA